MAAAQFKDLAFSALDHHGLAAWWCTALGYRRRERRPGEEWPDAWPVLITDPSGSGPRIWFTPRAESDSGPETEPGTGSGTGSGTGASREPGPGTGTGRLHLDLYGDVDALVALGATVVREPDGARAWHVLADPEGNRFGVFAPPAEGPSVSLGVR
ncbi:VOC family protein [Streptomyces otsuchiensis]|uniref:VOC family protein n=1 Tax=Streptomyces otsuchiensis TaxID=2681388 RepID=UPI00102F9A26|nr:VOC family protein [Streptomyces otsuchiensis]